MKTSIDLPDELYRRVKARSAMEGRAIREVATELLSAWVESNPVPSKARAPGQAPDTQEEWLYRWDALGARVAKANVVVPGAKATKGASGKLAAAKSSTLVEQLKRDRDRNFDQGRLSIRPDRRPRERRPTGGGVPADSIAG